MSAPVVATIGYERATLPEVIAKLKAAEVDLLVDVRAVAASRRAGFSKTILRTSLEAEGIEYLHLRALGTPKEGRLASRAGRKAEMRRIFATQLETPEAVDAFARLKALVQTRKAALLCYEEQAEDCHRRVLSDRLTAEAGLKIQDL